ncbi:MAG: hypothetical protein HY216_12690 [Candidatus Rokubacteria bacterium]|nr:hypothetical protein [Candidatus Rokubacteria bacterium]
MKSTRAIAELALGLVALGSSPLAAQEQIGRRVFSDTLVISEPFVEDELSLPSILHIRRPRAGDQPRTLATVVDAEIKKRLTPNLELSVAGTWDRLAPDRGAQRTAFDNLDIGLKYQFFRSDAHEAVASVALEWEVGGTGSRAVGAESFHTLSPTLLFGRGLGDLPDGLAALRPVAVSGALGGILPIGPAVARGATIEGNTALVPGKESQPHAVTWGLVLEYSLSYLKTNVRDIGLPAPLSQLVPLIEFDFQTPVDRESAGKTTGTINPGIVWVGSTVQVGIEAVIPANDRTGVNVGVRAFVRFALDEILGGHLGQPVFSHHRGESSP